MTRLLSVKDVSRTLHIKQKLVYEAAAKGLIETVEAKAGRNPDTGEFEWDYRFSPEALEQFGIWLRAQAHAELQVQDNFEFGVRKRLYNYNLRAARLKIGLTLAQLGSKVGVGMATVGQWESLRAFPSAVQRQAVADVLGLSVGSLFPAWLVEFKLQSGPAIITDSHYSLEKAIASRIDLPSLPAPGEDTLRQEAILDALSTLTDREQLVLRQRYGLDGADDATSHTLEQVGHSLGVTRERIRQIEAKAMRKLRHPTRSRKLRDFLE